MPDVSVLIPCWNASGAIGRALASVLEQPDLDLEVVVVDDGSTDGSADVVAEIAAHDPRVVLLRQPVNLGVSSARNAGLEQTRGTWLTLLDADDRFMPGGLAALHRRALETEALAVVGQQVWSNGRRTWVGPLYDNPDIRRPGRKSLATATGLLYYASPHGKLYHHSVVAGLRFEGRVLGDQAWVIRGLLRAGDRLEVISDLVYEWIRAPSPGSGPSITASTRSSVARGVEAAEVAIGAHAAVRHEAEACLAGSSDDAQRVSSAYAERLLRSDLAAHLGRALDRKDPSIGLLFDAIGHFVIELPPATLSESEALARDILGTTLARWPRVAPNARSAFWSLAATSSAVQPDLTRHAGSVVARVGLEAALGSPGGPLRAAGISLLVAAHLASAPMTARRAIRRFVRRT
jgi:hypothetical protein